MGPFWGGCRGGVIVGSPSSQGRSMARFHEFEMPSLEGDQVAFSTFADAACLVVNVASA